MIKSELGAPFTVLLSKGQVIAVFADDQDHDHFLLEVQETVDISNTPMHRV